MTHGWRGNTTDESQFALSFILFVFYPRYCHAIRGRQHEEPRGRNGFPPRGCQNGNSDPSSESARSRLILPLVTIAEVQVIISLFAEQIIFFVIVHDRAKQAER